MRGEHLMGLAERIDAIENILKVFAMERLFDTAMRLGKQKEALEVSKLFEEMYFDTTPHTIDELREALEKLELQVHPTLGKLQKAYMKMYLDYLVPVERV